MKILHIGDLHLGKKIAGYSLLEDQKYFLNKTIDFMNENKISHLIIAGDIYDISSPSGEAISIFSEFLNNLKNNNIKAFIISGNHDSNDRVGYGNKLISSSNIFINTNIKESITPITVDGINYYLIPYASAFEINNAFGKDYKTYDEAMAFLIDQMNIDKSKINIAVSHQLVLPNNGNPLFGGSEEPIIGTIQNINSNIYKDFTYVALGHIHRPQKVGNNIRYCGSPLAYHVDETKYDKTYTIIDINNGKADISETKIIPFRDFVEIKDTFENIINNYPEYVNSYIYATITGSETENAMAILKNKYPYAISLRYQRNEIKGVDITKRIEDIESISNDELFKKLFYEQTNKELSEYQLNIINKLFKEME